MRYRITDKKYRFVSFFDTETGAYLRTGVLDENGKDTGVDPFMASYPHLIDVGIMGHCIHGKTGLCAKAGIGCYQSGMFVEQTMAMLSACLSPESSLEQIAECIEEYAEPGSYQGEESELFDLENKTVRRTITIDI